MLSPKNAHIKIKKQIKINQRIISIKRVLKKLHLHNFKKMVYENGLSRFGHLADNLQKKKNAAQVTKVLRDLYGDNALKMMILVYQIPFWRFFT